MTFAAKDKSKVWGWILSLLPGFPRLRAVAVAALFGFSISAWAAPANVYGRAVYVDDGDTIVLLIDGATQITVRLSSIDAPESSHTNKEAGRIGQPYSENSGKYLASLIKGKYVQGRCFEGDRYGRQVCEIFLDGVSVNREMVAQGWAWANVAAGGRYLRDKSLIALEASARAARIGLWAGAHPVAPWEWRTRCWKQGQCSQ